jgi:hypothetical protein
MLFSILLFFHRFLSKQTGSDLKQQKDHKQIGIHKSKVPGNPENETNTNIGAFVYLHEEETDSKIR